jgi:hypothetical protein
MATARSTALTVALVAALAGCSLRSLDALTRGAPPDAAPTRFADPVHPRPDAAAPTASAPPDAARPEAAAASVVASVPDAGPAAPDVAPRPPDAPPPSPPAPVRVYFVVGSVPLTSGDSGVQQRLAARHLEVVLVLDRELAAVDTGPAALIVVSQSARAAMVGARFRDVATPVLTSEPGLYDNMGMVSVGKPEDHGFTADVTSVRIDDAASPLAAGLTGTVGVLATPGKIAWGVPGAAAARVASLPGAPTLATLFAYDKGAAMPALVAPARRLAFFQLGGVLTDGGWALFDAAVTWALASAP